MASRAICAIVVGVVPVDPPAPALSNVTTRRSRASVSTSAGSQLSRLPRKCWRSTSAGVPSPTWRYAYSIPFAEPFAAAFGGIPALLLGPSDPSSRIHGEDESLHLDDWRKLIVSQTRLLAELAEAAPTA